MKLSVIHCTRAGADPISPRRSRTTRNALARLEERLASKSGQHEVEYIFSVDEDDSVCIDMVQDIVDRRRVEGVRYVVCGTKTKWGPRLCHCNALNQGADAATGDVVMQGDDDVVYPAGWDTIVNDRLAAVVECDWDRPAVLGVGDPHFGGGEYSGDGMLGTFIVTRGVLARQGYFVYPEFDGMQGDIDFTAKAALEGWLVDAYDQVYFRHYWHGGEMDEQRDAIHDRHMSAEAHHLGYAVLGSRFHAGLPNISLNAVLQLQPRPAHRDFHDGRLSPDATWSERYYIERCQRGFENLRNLPQREGSAPYHWLRGEWAEAQAAVGALIDRYHRKICGGRFSFAYGFWLWNECAARLGQPPREDQYR